MPEISPLKSNDTRQSVSLLVPVFFTATSPVNPEPQSAVTWNDTVPACETGGTTGGGGVGVGGGVVLGGGAVASTLAMYAVADGSLHVKLAWLSAPRRTPDSRYDCCIEGIASTALPASSVSRRSLPLNQSSASRSEEGLKFVIVRFSFQAHVIACVCGVVAIDSIAAGSGDPSVVGVASDPIVAESIERVSSDSGAKSLLSRRSTRASRRAWVRRIWRLGKLLTRRRRTSRAFMDSLRDRCGAVPVCTHTEPVRSPRALGRHGITEFMERS